MTRTNREVYTIFFWQLWSFDIIPGPTSGTWGSAGGTLSSAPIHPPPPISAPGSAARKQKTPEAAAARAPPQRRTRRLHAFFRFFINSYKITWIFAALTSKLKENLWFLHLELKNISFFICLHKKICIMSSARARLDLEEILHLMKMHLSPGIRKLYNCCAKPLLRKAMYYFGGSCISLNLMKT